MSEIEHLRCAGWVKMVNARFTDSVQTAAGCGCAGTQHGASSVLINTLLECFAHECAWRSKPCYVEFTVHSMTAWAHSMSA